MLEVVKKILMTLLSISIYVALGALASWLFYYLKKRELFAGFLGGLVIGAIGALIGGFVLDKFLLNLVIKLLTFLVENPANVNIITSFIGGYFAVWLMARLINKERKKY